MNFTPMNELEREQLGIALACSCGTEIHAHVGFDVLDLEGQEDEDPLETPLYSIVRSTVKKFVEAHGNYPSQISFYALGSNNEDVYTAIHSFEQVTREIAEMGLDSVGDSVRILLDQAGRPVS